MVTHSNGSSTVPRYISVLASRACTRHLGEVRPASSAASRDDIRRVGARTSAQHVRRDALRPGQTLRDDLGDRCTLRVLRPLALHTGIPGRLWSAPREWRNGAGLSADHWKADLGSAESIPWTAVSGRYDKWEVHLSLASGRLYEAHRTIARGFEGPVCRRRLSDTILRRCRPGGRGGLRRRGRRNVGSS